MVTLNQLLESRDRRQERQRQLIAAYPGKALVVLTVVAPGTEKRTPASLTVAQAATQAIEQATKGHILLSEQLDLPTGYEGWYLIEQSPAEVKKMACAIEEEHPLGRLMDIDVIGPDGVPLSRQDAGYQQRRCLICGRPARVCMRERTHTVDELLAAINQAVSRYGAND
ncbi:MAG: citrate lyase holo-[acyl-carrier protein] synthase [Bacteroidales bacterium]|nr:citrate lyase holo-[acyl-carrier protein] synthase [Bacteroidales bacterium]